MDKDLAPEQVDLPATDGEQLTDAPASYKQGEARTLDRVLGTLGERGFAGQLASVEGGRVRCLTCRRVSAAADIEVETIERLEGASDPDDMLAVIGVRCPHCHTGGTLVLGYGPDSSSDDSDVLAALPDPTDQGAAASGTAQSS